MFKNVIIIALIFITHLGFCQDIQSGFPIIEEFIRRKSLLDSSIFHSFNLRPLDFSLIQNDFEFIETNDIDRKTNFGSLNINFLPIFLKNQYNSKRPYGWGDYGMRKNVGFQTYISSGIYANWGIFHIQFQPEFVSSQNLPFEGYSGEFSSLTNRIRFLIWNRADDPERFGVQPYSRFWLGQSKFSIKFRTLEFGFSTQNIFWGPGQFNSLLLNHNAEGFPHITFNSARPAKTFFGNFEWQMISGKIYPSNQAPSQNIELNENLFIPFPNDWKYINAVTISYNPKWIKGLYLGFARTFQVFSSKRGNSFSDIFPVFEAFQKKRFFDNGNSVIFDANGRDQQVSVFGRYIFTKSKFELYFEFGRKDHAFNWRDFTLNPEHARSFLIGLNKVGSIEIFSFKKFQLRSEVTHLQQSINRIIRYDKDRHLVFGNTGFGTHGLARGFSNLGQPMGGSSIGTGSNIQILEFSLLRKIDKVGFMTQRLVNHQDFYYSVFDETERKPWVDLSFGLLFDKQYKNLLFSSTFQLIHSRNYQWQLDPASTPEFPKGKNLTSFMAQTSLIYFWKKKEK